MCITAASTASAEEGEIRLQSHHPAKTIKLTEIKSHKERKQASCQK